MTRFVLGSESASSCVSLTAQESTVRYFAVGDYWSAEKKRETLLTLPSVNAVGWSELRPRAGDWLATEHSDEFATYTPLGTKQGKSARHANPETIFKYYCLGVLTNRNDVVYGDDKRALLDRVKQFIEDYNAEVFRYQQSDGETEVDAFVRYDKIKWSRDLKRDLKNGRFAKFAAERIRESLYRVYYRRWFYFDPILNQDLVRWPYFLPNAAAESENRVVCVAGVGNRKGFGCIATNRIANLDLAFEKVQCFPFYVYDKDGTNRRENVTDWALKQFRDHYQDNKIDKEAIFHYVYGLLHHKGYREKFADNLKRELPRIPFAPDFRAFAKAGRKLAALHLDYEQAEPWDLEFVEAPGVPLSYRVENKMRLSKDKLRLTINPSLTLVGIPSACLEYRLGNRSALEWVIDQYRVSTGKRSGITSDPNSDDDPESIVRLIGQVIRVSIETVAIVKSLPAFSTDAT